MRDKSLQEILDTFDVNRQTVARWIKQGLPCDSTVKGKHAAKSPKLFDCDEVASWLKGKGLTGKSGRPTGPMSEQLMAAKLRKENAMAEMHEIKVAREKGLLVEKAEAESNNVRKFTVIRNKLTGLPGAVAPSITGMEAPDIERELEQRITEILQELSRE